MFPRTPRVASRGALCSLPVPRIFGGSSLPLFAPARASQKCWVVLRSKCMEKKDLKKYVEMLRKLSYDPKIYAKIVAELKKGFK